MLPYLREGCYYIHSCHFLQYSYPRLMQIIVKTDLLLKRKKIQGYGVNLKIFFFPTQVSRKELREAPMQLTRAAVLIVLYFQKNNQDIIFLIEGRGTMCPVRDKRKAKEK